MSFLTPLMLIGVLSAAIPVAIHLFFRSRYRTVPWAAMKFLLTSVEQTSRRLKFQEYILLLCRMFLLTLLVCITATWWLHAWVTPDFGRNLVRFIVGYALLGVLWVVLGLSYPFMSAG